MIRKFILVSVLAAAASSAFATSQVWNFDQNSVGGNSTGAGNVATFTSTAGYSVSASAWSSTGAGCGTISGNNKGGPAGSDSDSCIESGELVSFGGGLGIINRNESSNAPNHAIDNLNTNSSTEIDVDMVLFTFDREVSITGLGATQQSGHDFDASIAAFTASNGASEGSFANFADNNWNDILGNGWDVVDNVANGAASGSFPNRSFSISDGTVYSKYWLVGAYNTGFNDKFSDFNDAFKLAGLTTIARPEDTTSPTNVSTPGTIVMFSLVAGLMLFRKK